MRIIVPLHVLARFNALHTLGTGEHMPFCASWLKAHGAGMFTRIITLAAFFCALAVKRDHHCLSIAHPDQALEHANRAPKTTKQVSGKGEFNDQ